MRTWKRYAIPLVVAAFLIVPRFAAADETKRVESLEGEVIRLERAPGLADTGIIATLLTKDGRETTVRLGPRRALRGLDLGRGDRLTLSGHFDPDHAGPTFIAQRIDKAGQVVVVDQTRQRGRDARSRELRGRVAGLRGVVVDNVRRILADIEIAPGERETVDLGPADAVQEFHIRVGDTVTVRGKPGQLGQRLLLLAEGLTAGDRSLVIPRDARPARIEGQVIGLAYGPAVESRREHVVGDGNLDTSHLLALVADANGNETWIDLGAASRLEGVTIGLGDQIAVRGPEFSATGPILGSDGQPLLVARLLEKDGRSHRLGLDTQSGLQATQPGTIRR